MVPVLSKNNQPIPDDYKETIADTLLAPYDNDLAIIIRMEDGKDAIVPVWRFIERFLRIKDKSGRFTVFEINEAQCKFYIELCEQKRAGKPMRVNILKARQLGFSTFIAAIIFVLTILVPNQTASIIADTAEHATNLFKKYKFYYENLPDYFKKKLPRIANNAKDLSVAYGMGQSSSIRVLVQGENAGRSDTCQFLHLSEVAFWQNIKDTTTSVLQTVDDNNPNSIIIYETTANGVNDYKEIWDDDIARGEEGYKPLFYPWFLDKNYQSKYWGFELFEWEKELMNKHHLSLEQIAWYRMQFNKMRGDLNKLRQEMPSSPTEAFIVSGTSVFNMELLLQRKSEILSLKPLRQGFFAYEKSVSSDGGAITIKNVKWMDSRVGPIKIYKDVMEGHPYVVNNDPAMGGEDYFATQVIDNHTGEQVAVYHKNKCDADEVAFQMYCLAKHYNGALVSGETNTTAYILKLVRKCGYRFIYQDQDFENLSGRYQDKLGYKTKQNNRQGMIEQFAEAFRDNPKIISDYETICEMENFQVVRNDTTGKEKAQATQGKHDDLVMAMCGFYLCRGSQTTLVSDINNKKDNKTLFEIEEEVERKRRNLFLNPHVLKGNFIEVWD